MRTLLGVAGDAAFACVLLWLGAQLLFGIFPLALLPITLAARPLPWAEAVWSLGFLAPSGAALVAIVRRGQGKRRAAWMWALVGLAITLLLWLGPHPIPGPFWGGG